MGWLSIIGMVLEYLSFWFVTWELLGPDRLRAIEQRLEKNLVYVLVAVLFAGIVLPFSLLSSRISPLINNFVNWVFQLIGPYLGILVINIQYILLIILVLAPILRFSNSFEQKVINPLLRYMADDANEKLRQRFLILGAIFLTIGVTLQIISAIYSQLLMNNP
jgi:hypothetical protein